MAEAPHAQSRRLNPVLRVLFGFRLIMLAGSVGALFGSVMMFWQGGLYLVDAFHTLTANSEHTERQVTVPILEAVDAFLFGVVLVIFAYGIAVGFVIRLPERMRQLLPAWMKIEGVGQLKAILAEVVIVVLVVIFARVVVEAGSTFTWTMLVLPISILLLAGAIRVLELGDEAHARDEASRPSVSDTPRDPSP